jgi:dephospho-CoA kinase
MLRVGLTGDLGSGKSTVAEMLAAKGAFLLSSDAIGRELMQPGHDVYDRIVESFGTSVVKPDGTLDRAELARLAFDTVPPRLEELNAIVHPAVIEEQRVRAQRIGMLDPHAIVVVESALIFTTMYDSEESWRTRFDTIVCVTASEDQKIQRFLERTRNGAAWTPAQTEAARADALNRLQAQKPAAAFQKNCLLLANDSSPEDLTLRVDALWGVLTRLEAAIARNTGAR